MQQSARQLIESTQAKLAASGYIADRDLATSMVLFQQLGRPILFEGAPGVGKTEIAYALAQVNDCRLIRLQCYEGLDAQATLYEWNYQYQLLSLRLMEIEKVQQQQISSAIFSRQYLLERPLLQAITQETSPVLLIDEIDRADEEFEAFLLELLSEYQVSIPELGTIKATAKPHVVLTSNGTRELSDALKRRCLYHYLEFPEFDKELSIVLRRLPETGAQLARQIVGFVQQLRQMKLSRRPGIAETLDWAAALLRLNVTSLEQEPEALLDSMICLLKSREDRLNINELDLQRLAAKSV